MMKTTRLFSTLTLAISLLASAPSIAPTLHAFSVAALPEEHDQVRESIAHLNNQIDSVTRLKNYYQSKSVRYRNRATRLRFQDSEGSEAESENLIRQADDYDQVVKKLNAELVKLKRQKFALEKKLND